MIRVPPSGHTLENTTRWQHQEDEECVQVFLTSSVKTPITGLWSLMLYSMLLVYRSCLIFRGYSSSSSICVTFPISAPTLFSPCSSWEVSLGRSRHRILSVQAGFLFLELTWSTKAMAERLSSAEYLKNQPACVSLHQTTTTPAKRSILCISCWLITSFMTDWLSL